MPTSFYIFLLGATVLVVTPPIRHRVADKRIKSLASGLNGAAALVVAGVVLYLMWDAWSPWDISLEGR